MIRRRTRRAARPVSQAPSLLIVNPSGDVYGADLQMLESAAAAVGEGWQVTVLLPDSGELVPRLSRLGAAVGYLDFPVLRRSSMSAGGLVRLAVAAALSIVRIIGYLTKHRPTVVYVNTMTLPWWLVGCRLAGTPVVCHVHEAETTDSVWIRRVLNAPLLFADRVVLNGRPAKEALAATQRRLADHAAIVVNGVPEPPSPLTAKARKGPLQLLCVARLSPRKGTHDALEALAILVARGWDLQLELAGSAFEGYEWYVEQLRERSEREDLRGRVRFAGYCDPIWERLEHADIVVAPAHLEPLGNAVIEALLAQRPVVATAVQGHLESIIDGATGLLSPVGDPTALADAIEKLAADPELAGRLALAGRHHAQTKFGLERYRREIMAQLKGAAGRP